MGQSPRGDGSARRLCLRRMRPPPGHVSGFAAAALVCPLRAGRGCDGGRLRAGCDEQRERPPPVPRAPWWRSEMPWAPPLLCSYVLGKTVFDSFRTRTLGAPALKRWSARDAWDTRRRQPTDACNRPRVRHGTGCSPRTTQAQRSTARRSVFEHISRCANGHQRWTRLTGPGVRRLVPQAGARPALRFPRPGRRRPAGRRSGPRRLAMKSAPAPASAAHAAPPPRAA